MSLVRTRQVLYMLLLVVGLLVGSAFTFAVNGWRVGAIESNSMSPTIKGETGPDQNDGGIVLFRRTQATGVFHSNDLVVVELTIDGRQVVTVRRIRFVPGDSFPIGTGGQLENKVPADCFWIVAESPNGIDSSTLGFIRRSAIQGRVWKWF